jgi:hypothetical protein
MRSRWVSSVAGRDADVPAARFPLAPFVVGQRAGGHGEDGLPASRCVAALDVELENARLARAGGRVDDHVRPAAQRAHGVLLPEIRQVERNFEAGHKDRIRRARRVVIRHCVRFSLARGGDQVSGAGNRSGL